jgi:hypothetical protein
MWSRCAWLMKEVGLVDLGGADADRRGGRDAVDEGVEEERQPGGADAEGGAPSHSSVRGPLT